jgi:hypothetical protein
MLIGVPFDGFAAAFAVDVDVVSVDEVSDGLADATHGIAVVVTTPAPIPKATASTPTRPI